MTVLLILTGALLTIASCWAAGRLLFRYAGLPMQLTGPIQFGTGAAVLSTTIFALCALHLISTISLAALGLGLIATLRFTPGRPKPTLWLIPFAVFGAF